MQKIVLKILWQYYMEICRTRYNILLVEIFLALHEIEKSIQGAIMGVLLIINLVPMYLTNLCIQMVKVSSPLRNKIRKVVSNSHDNLRLRIVM